MAPARDTFGIDLIDAARRPFLEEASTLSGAIVYLDSGAGEALRFSPGLRALLSFGVLHVGHLKNPKQHHSHGHALAGEDDEDDEVDDEDDEEEGVRVKGPSPPLVIFLTNYLNQAHSDVMRVLQTHPNSSTCTIYCTVSEAAHATSADNPFGADAFQEYTDLLSQELGLTAAGTAGLEEVETEETRRKTDEKTNTQAEETDGWDEDWGDEGWGNMEAEEEHDSEQSKEEPAADASRASGRLTSQNGRSVQVRWFPPLVCPLTSSSFVLPAASPPGAHYCHLRPPTSHLNPPTPHHSSSSSDSSPLSDHLLLLAHTLAGVGFSLGLGRLEAFSLGPQSASLARQLAAISPPPQGGGRGGGGAEATGAGGGAVVLVDRALDLYSPAALTPGGLLARVLHAQHRRHEVVTPMSSSSGVQVPTCDVRVDMSPLFPLHPRSTAATTAPGLHSPPPHPHPPIPRGPTSSCSSPEDLLSGSTPSPVPLLGAGVLGMPEDPQVGEWIQLLVDKSTKEGMLAVRKWLLEALRADRIELPNPVKAGETNTAELEMLLQTLLQGKGGKGASTLGASPAEGRDRAVGTLRHRSLHALTRAVMNVMQGTTLAHWEALVSLERALTETAVGGQTGGEVRAAADVAFLLTDLLTQCGTRDTGGCGSAVSLNEALGLVIGAYTLLGPHPSHTGAHLQDSTAPSADAQAQHNPFLWEDQHRLKGAVVEAVMSLPEQAASLTWLQGLQSRLLSLIDSQHDEGEGDEEKDENADESDKYGTMQLKLEVGDRVEDFFDRLSVAAATRRQLKSFKEPLQQAPLLQQVSGCVASRSPLGDLCHAEAAGSLRGLLKSGLGRFGLQAKPHPSDKRVIIFFVVGGISLNEISAIKKAFQNVDSERTPEILVGSTGLLDVGDVCNILNI